MHMDSNYLDTLSREKFAGLQNLEYLNVEYNAIQLNSRHLQRHA